MTHWSTLPELRSLPLELHHDWGCFCQAGDNGIVFVREGNNYRTAYFEAFPRSPDTFLRGEGQDIVEAEEQCWQQYEKIKNCHGHEFERRGYRNGGGFCKYCGLFSMVFEPLEKCVVCGKPTYHTQDNEHNWYCHDHSRSIPPDKWTDYRWDMAYDENELFDWDKKH